MSSSENQTATFRAYAPPTNPFDVWGPWVVDGGYGTGPGVTRQIDLSFQTESPAQSSYSVQLRYSNGNEIVIEQHVIA